VKKSIILVGILALGLILLAGCRQRPKEVELEKKELIPLEEMVPLEEMAPLKPRAEVAPVIAEAPFAVAPIAPAAATGKININTATQAQLETLPRIGPKTYEGLKDLITVGGAAAPAVTPTVAPAVTPIVAPAVPAEPVYKKVDTDGDGIPDTYVLYQATPAATVPTAAPTIVAPAKPTAGKINRLKAKDYPAYIEEVELKGKKWYRVRVGSFRDRDDALKLADKLKEKEGLKESIVWKK